jgi:hypothetical protein
VRARALLATLVLLGAPAAVGSACASSGPRPEVSPVTLPPTSAPRATGSITAGDDRFDFAGVCYDVGAGDVVVLGSGTDVRGRSFDVLLQAFFGESYVGVDFADGTLLEPALDSPVDLSLEGDIVRGRSIRFVTGLDLDGARGSTAGEGAVEVTCGGYARGLPMGYDDDGAPVGAAGS